MILNVSGRTDIIAFYTDWFLNRYQEGYIDVRNPFYPKQISRIELKDVDAILFCTKNPLPILKHLDEIKKPIFFHITLTSYKKDIEPNVPNKKDIIEAIKQISAKIGIENVYLRYDPIFINEKYTIEYHIKAFDRICTLLDGYIKHIIISFLDDYKNVRKNQNIIKPKKLTETDYKQIGENLIKSARKHNISIQTCCEDKRLTEYGFLNQDCLSKELAARITGKTKFKKWKARNNKNCNCVEMVDIGVYNSCSHFCKYCYANYDEQKVLENKKKHNPNSSLLIGELEKDDIIKIRQN